MDTTIFGQVVLSYCPIIDRARNVMATRLTVFPLVPGEDPPTSQLLQAVNEVWPVEGATVVLSVRSEALLASLLGMHLQPHVMLEVPHFMADDPANAQDIMTLAAAGNTLLLSGRPDHALPPELVSCFKYSIVDVTDERRHGPTPANAHRKVGFMQDGVRSVAEMEQAFTRGAVAVIGWPIDELAQKPKISARSGASRPDLQATVQLINLVDREAPLDQLEAALKRDPALAYKLLRYINSPLFGLRVEVSSFSHAVMLLGYQRLKRWLALLLITASNEPNLRPVMFAAVRRGLLMEAFMPEADETVRGELFICGVFSLLDRMFQQHFSELIKVVPVPETVSLALVDDAGPYAPMVHLLRSLEGGAGLNVQDAAEAAMLDMRAVNRALLHALAGAVQLS
jgi:EAL and modified HD-GYP domain-containing signal transduction protein